MATLLAIFAAVAGGNLAVTAAPTRPHVGRRVVVRSTGQVTGQGRFYLYRNLRRSCSASAAGERRRGVLLASRAIDGSFDFTVSYRPRWARREWVCGYLYAITCDATGHDCGPATGLPPDAGFDQVRISVRSRSQSVKSAAASGRVIT